MIHISSNRRRGASTLYVLACIAVGLVIAGAAYGLFLVNQLTHELNQLSCKMDRLNKLESVAEDIHALTKRLSVLEETNRRMARVEKFMSYVPKLAKTGDMALEQTKGTNQRLETTNQRLLQTDLCLTGTVNRLMDVTESLRVMPDEMKAVRGSIDKMTSDFPALGEMRDLLVKTNASLDKTTAGIEQVSSGFTEMRGILKEMSDQFAVLPEMKAGLDTTSATITGALFSFQPLAAELPRLNQNLAEMNQTTKDLTRSVKQAPKQGAIGIGILTAAEFLSH